MNKAYSRINFQNAPSTATPLNATNLNKMDKAINDLDDRIIELSGYQEEAEESAEMASASASAAAKAAETATADAEARVNEVIQGLEVYTKADSHKKFASVIKQVATGSPILIKDGAGVEALDFKGKGRSTQKQYSGKNLLKPTISTGNASGVTFTKNSDGSYTVNGTNTETTEIWQSLGDVILADEDYIISSGNYGKGAGVFINGSTQTTFDKQSIVSNSDKNKSLKWGIGVKAGVTLNNVIIYPQLEVGTVATDYEPYVGGVASPNPDYPQPINSVADGGWFDGELLQGFYSGTGVFTSNSTYVCSRNPIPCNSGDTIKLAYGTTASEIAFIFYDKDMAIINRPYGANATEYETTTPTNAKYVHFYLREPNISITPTKAKPITVTINGKYALIVKSAGKNLLDTKTTVATWNGITYTPITNENGKVEYVSISGTKTSDTYFILPINATKLPSTLKAGNKYIVSANSTNSNVKISVIELVNGNYVTNSTATEIEWTPNANATQTIIRIDVGTSLALNDVRVYPMIRPIGTDGTYEPYKETISYIPLNEPLRSSLDGTVTDEVSLTEVNRRFAEVVFDGSDDEVITAYGNNYPHLFRISVRGVKETIKNIICTHFPSYRKANNDYSKNMIYTLDNYILINHIDITTVDEFKAWLKANPITVVYELTEPIVEAIEPVDIVTYDNVTYLTASDNADMEVTYATDTKSYIDSKFAELHAALVNML